MWESTVARSFRDSRLISIGGGADGIPDGHDLEDSWVAIAEEEERSSRRSSVGGTLNKMLGAVVKHKWAYPFKRPVTEKEAPDYKDIVPNPMDFATLKRRVETGAVADVGALVSDLNLIFDNAMTYNGEGTDYYQMAETLKAVVAHQAQLYHAKKAEAGGNNDKGTPAEGKAEEVKAAVVAPPADDDKPKGRGRRGGR